MTHFFLARLISCFIILALLDTYFCFNSVFLFCVSEMHRAFPLPVIFIFFSVFYQWHLWLQNWKSLFLILKIFQYGGESSFFSRYLCQNWYKNWCIDFHKICNHQIWQAGTYRGVDANETNHAGAGDVIMSRSFEKPKTSPLPVLLTTKLGRIATYLDVL